MFFEIEPKRTWMPAVAGMTNFDYLGSVKRTPSGQNPKERQVAGEACHPERNRFLPDLP
jgi:hypothetical protein